MFIYLCIIEYLYRDYSIQLLRHEKNVSMITNDIKVNHIKARKPKKKNIGDIYLQYHHLSNDGSDESKDSNNKSKEGADSIFRVVFKEEQYKYSLALDTAQYPRARIILCLHERGSLVKTVFIKNSVHENIHSVKTLDFEKDIHNDKQK